MLNRLSGVSRNFQHFPFWIGWQIWKSRNDLIFNNVSHDADSTIMKAEENLDEWISATSVPLQCTASVSNQTNQHHWQRPPPGLLKCNIDSSYVHDKSHIRVG